MSKQSAKILIADDDDSLRRVLEFQLQEAGYEVIAADNGRQALDFFSSEHIDCLITDWRMPQMSGSELVQLANAISG